MFYSGLMRWQGLQVNGAGDGDGAGRSTGDTPLPLLDLGATVRRVDTPEFRGVTFYEVRAKSVLNRVPDTSPVPFRWTVNPYRGCTHACVYCFARQSHTYLDLDAGADFDSRVVVKVNAGEVAARELATPRWAGEPVALGTNVDPYQRAEGRYRVTRDVIEALVSARNPFSVLTKGTLVLRDLDLLTEGARHAQVSVATSVGSIDERAWRGVEPGTPAPGRRLDVMRRLVRAGLGGGVLLAPILPGLTDSDEQLDATVRAIADSGASWLAPMPLRLPPGAREWWWAWLRREHPGLVGRYRWLYGDGGAVRRSYADRLRERVAVLAQRYGLACSAGGRTGHERRWRGAAGAAGDNGRRTAGSAVAGEGAVAGRRGSPTREGLTGQLRLPLPQS